MNAWSSKQERGPPVHILQIDQLWFSLNAAHFTATAPALILAECSALL